LNKEAQRESVFQIIGSPNKQALKTADFDKSVIHLPGYFLIAQ